jgi:hypothetical protein
VPTLPISVPFGWGRKHHDDGSWVGIASAILCTGPKTPYLTIQNQSRYVTADNYSMDVLIQLDADLLPGKSVYSCVLTASYTNHDPVVSSVVSVQKQRVWFGHFIKGRGGYTEHLPKYTVSIRHAEEQLPSGAYTRTISTILDYSLNGTCRRDFVPGTPPSITPTPRIDEPIKKPGAPWFRMPDF